MSDAQSDDGGQVGHGKLARKVLACSSSAVAAGCMVRSSCSNTWWYWRAALYGRAGGEGVGNLSGWGWVCTRPPWAPGPLEFWCPC